MRELKLNYPLDRKIEILTKDQELCKKAHAKNKEREKEGKFYVLKGYKPETTIFIPNGENVKKYIENYIKKLESRVSSLHKIKI